MASKRFHIHEATQRGLCRLGFMLLGAAPVMWTVYLCLLTWLPGYHRRQAEAWESILSSRLGLTVHVDASYALAPLHYRLVGVELRVPSSEKLVARIPEVEMSLDQQSCWELKMEQAELRLDQLAHAGRILQQNFLAPSRVFRPYTRLSCKRATISDDVDVLEVFDLLGVMPRKTEFDGLKLDFKIVPPTGRLAMASNSGLSAAQSTSASMLHASQDRRVSLDRDLIPVNNLMVFRQDPSSSFHDLGLALQSPVACSVLFKLFGIKPIVESTEGAFGAWHSGQFVGVLELRTVAEKTYYCLRNASVTQFELASLGDPSGVLVSGNATITNLNAILDHSQVRTAQGELRVGPGRIDGGFLRSATFHWGLSSTQPDSLHAVGFDRLSIRFALTPEYFELEGIGSQPGVILEDARGPVVWKEKSALPLVAMIHALAFRPDNPALPARITPLVRAALRWLPVDEQQRRGVLANR